MIRVRRTATALALSGLSIAMVAACSSSGGSKDANTSGSNNQPPSSKTDNGVNDIAATSRDKIKQGGNFTYALSQVIPNFNYSEVDGTLVDNANVIGALLPRPFHFTASGVPSVNTDYFTSITKTSTSPQTIDYKINPKAKWSNGRAMDWEDIADLWKASNGDNSAYKISGSTGYDQIESVTKGADAQEAIVKFSKPFTDWQSLFDYLPPKEITSTPTAFNTAWVDHPTITAGPFKWGSQNKTAKTYTIVADPNWWGDKAKLDSITFQVYNDLGAAVQALGTGGLDYADITFGDEVNNVKAAKKYPKIDIREAGSNVYRQFTLNTKSGVLSDEKVRQAVVLGINRAAMTKALIGALGGNPSPLQNHFFMKNQAPYKATCGDYCSYNPTKAVSLLKADGWTKSGTYFTKSGKTLTTAITIPSDTPNSLLEARIAQATLKAVGVQLTINTVPTDDFFSKYIIPGNFGITTFTWVGTAFPIGGALSIFKLDPKNVGQNYGSGGSDAINSQLASASTALSADQENTEANQASQAMWDNAAWLPLYQKPQSVAVVKNLVNIGAYGFADIRYQNVGYLK